MKEAPHGFDPNRYLPPPDFEPDRYITPDVSPPEDFDASKYFEPSTVQVESIPETDWIPAAGAEAPPVRTGGAWEPFGEETGTLGVPRSSMPQIKSMHRGAMVQFLKGRGITHSQEEVAPNALKPTQAEFSPEKVERARTFEGPQRSILISSDDYVLDGHHQWLDSLTASPYAPLRAIRFDAPIQQLLLEASQFPSSFTNRASAQGEDITGGQSQDEPSFQSWYADWAKKLNLDPDPDAPEHHYDYRAAWRAGAEPNAEGHWPSQFKAKDHPNRFVEQDGEVIDSITGEPARDLTRPRRVDDVTGGAQQLSPPAGFRPEKYLPHESVTSRINDEADFSDEQRPGASHGPPDAVRIAVNLAPGEENSIEPDELARRAVYQFAQAHQIPLEFTNKWIVGQEASGNLRLHRLSDNQPTNIQELRKTSAYDPQTNTVTLHGDLPFFPQMLEDYERDKSYTQRIKDDFSDPDKRAGAVALDIVGPPAAAAARGLELASRPLQAVSTGLSGVEQAQFAAQRRVLGDEGAHPLDTLAGIPGAIRDELLTGETRPGYENPAVSVADRLKPALSDINPNLHGMVREVAQVVGDPLVTLGLVGRAGRVARAGAEVGEEARLAELASTIEKRIGVRPTLERLADDSIKVSAEWDGQPLSFTIPPGGLTSSTMTPATAGRLAPSLAGRAGRGALDLWNAGREIKTAYDFSAPRNAIIPTLTHPVHAMRNMAAQVKAFASEEAAANYLRAIRTDEVFPLAEKAGLKIQDFSGPIGERHELFRSAIVEAVPGVRASSRAFHTYLNGMRFSIFRDYALSHPHASPEDLKGVATFLNYATGQGSFGRYEGSRVVRGLSEALYAPRLTLSYAQTLASPATLETAAARRFAARQVVQAVGTGLALGALAKLTSKKTGIDFEFNPTATDAFKFTVGQQRINIFGGYTVLAKYTAQAITGERKTSSGQTQAISPIAPLATFARSRLHPSIGFILDLKTGKTLDGRELYDAQSKLKKGEALRDGLMPLSLGDIYDAVEAERKPGGSGLGAGLKASPALFGADVQTRYRGRSAKPITDGQKQFIRNLADESGYLNEDDEAGRMFGRKVTDLDRGEASQLIEHLKRMRDERKR